MIKVLSFVLIFIGLLLCSEGKQVNKTKAHGNVYLNQYFGALSNSKLFAVLHKIEEKLNNLIKKIGAFFNNTGSGGGKVPKNCAQVLRTRGGTKSGVYTVDPDGKGPFKVYCDQKTSGGGWTVFQRRQDGSVDFYRGWVDYKNGFGDLKGEFWLGLDKINRLTHQTANRLRVDLRDTKGKSAYAEYSFFAVASERAKYKLSVGIYTGNAGDSLSVHRGYGVTTKDRDHDAYRGNCAVIYKGAWWYTSCHASNLNGLYHHGKHKSYADGVNWSSWKGQKYSVKRAEMKIRPA